MSDIKITHYIDRQFGHVIHVGTENDRIAFLAKSGYGETFDNKLFRMLNGKTIEEAKTFFKQTFPGIYYSVQKFESPLNTKIEDYG